MSSPPPQLPAPSSRNFIFIPTRGEATEAPSPQSSLVRNNCMLGIQPRPHLRPRPSLQDLIVQSHHRQSPFRPRSSPAPAPASASTPSAAPAEALTLPLPESPSKTGPPRQSTSNLPQSGPRQFPRVPVKMPSKRKEAEAGEEHHGAVFSVSGPVIVAEHMLGCAMYELVRFTRRPMDYGIYLT